jgi:CO dehydrogenase nickel-insertion accessory protein CooC1
MVEYRLYAVDGDGNLGLPDLIGATDDEEAIAKARELKPDMRRCEIWQGKRLVAAFNREDSSEAA